METKLTVENLANRIARDNEIFNKATDAEKRVIVAEDCLSRIDLGQISPITGNFCSIGYDVRVENGESSIKDVLNTSPDNVVICESCAKGSLLMSYLGRVNEFTFDDLGNGNNEYDKNHKKLLQLFSKEQLTLIETFFEGSQCIFNHVVEVDHKGIRAYRTEVFNRPENIKVSNKPNGKDSLYDYYDYKDAIEAKILMLEVCENIIANKGTFVVPSV